MAHLVQPVVVMQGARPSASHGLDLSRPFLPEALSGVASLRSLDEDERRRLNQIRAASYLHLFDLFETSLAEIAAARAQRDCGAREVLAPLLGLAGFDHAELFRGFERELAETLPAAPQKVTEPPALVAALDAASPWALLVLALHLKLVTQQHYLACLRGAEALEPRFVRVLREHWTLECGGSRTGERSNRAGGCAPALQQALGRIPAGYAPVVLADYRAAVFACDDVIARQGALDVKSLEAATKRALGSDEDAVVAAETAALRKTFLTVGIVNAAFVYAMRSLGPTAPAMLAGVVAALAGRERI